MSNKKCEDGSEVSLWSATKSIFKIVGCGLNAAAKATEAAAIEANKWAETAHDSSSIKLVAKLLITHANGDKIEDPQLAKLITSAYDSRDTAFREIVKIAEAYNLDISKGFISFSRTV